MAATQGMRYFALLQREFREYKTSLFWTPLSIAVVLALLMLGSVLLVNRISVFSDVLLKGMLEDSAGLNISITMVETGNGGIPVAVVERDDSHAGEPDIPKPPSPPEYEVIVEGDVQEEQWNFSREWRFNPDVDADSSDEDAPPHEHSDLEGEELQTMLSIVHLILLVALFLTSANYLLGSLYDDRKDRSILFWRSMPVSEWEVVLSKFAMAIVVAPLIYIAISLVLQLVFVLLMMLLVWRKGMQPFETVLGNLDFLALLGDPIGGWVLTALCVAPLYAYLLFASSAAKRSPFLMAVVPVLALMIAEGVFFGSEHVGDAIQNHFPHATDDSAVGFYLFGPQWGGISLASIGGGLVFAVAALVGAVWLRRHRWEL